MKQSTPAGFDHASHSELEMLARLRSYKTANQIRNRLREIGLRTTRTRVALGNILFAKGNESDFEFISADYKKGGLSFQKIGATSKYAEYLSKLSNITKIKAGVDDIISFRNSIPAAFSLY